jgi:hypothetical protein
MNDSSIRTSCLNDRPVIDATSDTLDHQGFVNGLYHFIVHADTPVTIGIQGGWGSGKTSLINMLKEFIEGDRHAFCVFVNAWEHSLLQTQGSKLEVTKGLLQGLLEGMHEAIRDFAPESAQKENFLNTLAKVSKVVAGLGLRAFVRTANKMDATGVLGFAIRTAADAGAQLDERWKGGAHAALSLAAATAIREMRKQIESVVKGIVADQRKDAPNRFVCFIDDLDRIQPEIAVDILDVIKNIFDIENCVFVLAIDYDVVVKGLEGKFGRKTEANEREFRQYFDKIIQIPFSMPVGTYENKMNHLLRVCFDKLGYTFPGEMMTVDVPRPKATPIEIPRYAFTDEVLSREILDNIRMVAMAATDGVPRSIKRIINTLSLMQYISMARSELGSDNTPNPNDLEIRFIVTALNINFPEISRKLMENSNFLSWGENESKRWELNTEEIDFKAIKEREGDLFNESWEQVVYCLCQSNLWLKARAGSASMILNTLRAALTRTEKNKNEINDNALKILDDILDDIRVVSVSSSNDVQLKVQTSIDSLLLSKAISSIKALGI